jgi:hypothetical protein
MFSLASYTKFVFAFGPRVAYVESIVDMYWEQILLHEHHRHVLHPPPHQRDQDSVERPRSITVISVSQEWSTLV